MRLFSIVLLFIVVRGTKSQSLVPSDAPCTEAPYSESPTLFEQCPKVEHSFVVENLQSTFGEDSCLVNNKGLPPGEYRLYCDFEPLAGDYVATANYRYKFIGCVERPFSLELTVNNEPLAPSDFVSDCFEASLLKPIQDKTWCQDKDEEIVEKMLAAFGEENCSEKTEDLYPIDNVDADGARYCTFGLSDYYAYAEYRYKVNGSLKRPVLLQITEGLDANTMNEYTTTFGAKAECFENGLDIVFEWIHRGRICTNPTGDIDYINQIGNPKTRTCKEIGEGKTVRLRTLCRRFSQISETCKGICQVGDFCRCQDNPFEFLYKDGTTSCRALLKLPAKKRERRCKKKKFKTHCPRICESCTLSGSPDEFDNLVVI